MSCKNVFFRNKNSNFALITQYFALWLAAGLSDVYSPLTLTQMVFPRSEEGHDDIA